MKKLIVSTRDIIFTTIKEGLNEVSGEKLNTLLNHTFLVVDKKNNKVIVAESTGGDVGVVFRAYGESEVTSLSLLDMTNYYSSNCK